MSAAWFWYTGGTESPQEFSNTEGLAMERGFLVLSRRHGERIHIGDDVVLVVVSVKGNRVRLGIDAPKQKHIVREEVKDRKAA